MTLTWTHAENAERSFVLDVGPRTVPGIVWLPADRPQTQPRPAVLLGHGGSGYKDNAHNRRLAAFSNAAGLTAVAIDGPFHGDRAPASGAGYHQLILAAGADSVAQDMTADWLATVATLTEAGVIMAAPFGYIGMSMGARYGLPLAAALGQRLGALVIGKFGLRQASPLPPGVHDRRGLSRAAQSIRCPTLMHAQSDDMLFPRAGQLELFDLLGTSDKRLVLYPGGHRQTPPGVARDWVDFVAGRVLPRP